MKGNKQKKSLVKKTNSKRGVTKNANSSASASSNPVQLRTRSTRSNTGNDDLLTGDIINLPPPRVVTLIDALQLYKNKTGIKKYTLS